MQTFSRIVLWLSKGNNAFNTALLVCFPPALVALVMGWFA